MKRERRQFDKEFKMMAVNLCLLGKATKEVADELGVRREIVASAEVYIIGRYLLSRLVSGI